MSNFFRPQRTTGPASFARRMVRPLSLSAIARCCWVTYRYNAAQRCVRHFVQIVAVVVEGGSRVAAL
jgi:hypothetical protein